MKDLIENFFIEEINCLCKRIVLYKDAILKIDPRLGGIIESIVFYNKGIKLGNLAGKACFISCTKTREIYINKNILRKFIKHVPQKYVEDAVSIFILHEINHINQGFISYYDVPKLKSIAGSSVMGQFDLRSDFVAVRILSLLRTLEESEEKYDEVTYLKHFYKLWCEIGECLWEAFPPKSNKAKQQRRFGAMLMASLVKKSYFYGFPVTFNVALWPEWSQSLDLLIIFGEEGDIWSSPTKIDPLKLDSILTAISVGQHRTAMSLIEEIMNELPLNRKRAS